MRIGIVAQETGEVFGVHQDYLHLAEMYGTPIGIFPVHKTLFRETYKIEALILPGGSDVNPSRYGTLTSFMAYRPNPFLEYFDTEILPEIITNKIPIFGICRGLQTLNVHFGGSLHQHLWHHPYSTNATHLAHEIEFSWNGAMKTTGVNSFHHQGIKKLGTNLEPTSFAKNLGLIESIRHSRLPIEAVQWHPERLHDQFSLNILDKLFS